MSLDSSRMCFLNDAMIFGTVLTFGEISKEYVYRSLYKVMDSQAQSGSGDGGH